MNELSTGGVGTIRLRNLPPASRPEKKHSTLGWLGRKISSLLVFGALGGLLFWGHHTGWSMPKFGLTGHGEQEEKNWCGEHNVPESECVECNPDLLPKAKSFGWCNVHGVHECPLCHPEVAQTKGRPQTAACGGMDETARRGGPPAKQ